jgi:hypothetical protein
MKCMQETEMLTRAVFLAMVSTSSNECWELFIMNPLSPHLLKEENFFTGGSYNSNNFFTTVPISVYRFNCGKAARFDLPSFLVSWGRHYPSKWDIENPTGMCF